MTNKWPSWKQASSPNIGTPFFFRDHFNSHLNKPARWATLAFKNSVFLGSEHGDGHILRCPYFLIKVKCYGKKLVRDLCFSLLMISYAMMNANICTYIAGELLGNLYSKTSSRPLHKGLACYLVSKIYELPSDCLTWRWCRCLQEMIRAQYDRH